MESKVIAFQDLAALSEELHREKRRIVSTNGCFDLLHWGHIKYLSQARQLGDVLICAVNSDSSVKKLKGDSRPIHSEEIRALQVAALETVDFVTIFVQDTPEEFIRILRPTIHVKGGDYLNKPLPERSLVESLGGKMVCLPLVEGYSTTSLIEKLTE